HIAFEYNTDLFNHATIQRMANHFETLLSGIVANPQQPIAELPLLTHTELQQLLVEWNATTADYTQAQCVHHVFEMQVNRTPDAVAVTFEDQALTYRQLNQKANQLAHTLMSHGVGPDILVGLFLERSLETVIGLLGIIKAGGAYVPLDPHYPKDRLVFMIQNSAMHILLTNSTLLKAFPYIRNLESIHNVICLDTDWPTISRVSTQNVVSNIQPNNLIYVIYTSGSTGQPKGVAMRHQSLFNLICWHLHNTHLAVPAKTAQ